MAVSRPAALGQLAFVALAFASLAFAFLTNDFSVKNVASNSFSQLPPVYRLTATWGSHEGSMLLWVLMLAGWTGALTALSRRLPAETRARTLGVLGLVSVGFLAFVVATSNPFDRLMPPPADGRDLNPLLQDAGMVLHPPMLYMGYVGFSVAFAFALAALLGGQLDAAWARWARPWTTLAWVFLTGGIALGAAGVKAVVVRTWDGLGISPGDQWLLGAELEGTLSQINFSVGLLKTFETSADRSWEWTGGVGRGF